MLQGLGLYDKVYSEIGFTPNWFMFHPGGHDLYAPPVLRGSITVYRKLTSGDHIHEGGHGHKGCLFHEQPMLGILLSISVLILRKEYPCYL